MPSERELKTQQEDKLFDILHIHQLIKDGKTEKLNDYLRLSIEKAQSGMSADEIDAVRERVTRANHTN